MFVRAFLLFFYHFLLRFWAFHAKGRLRFGLLLLWGANSRSWFLADFHS
jgi:hypothetical protein